MGIKIIRCMTIAGSDSGGGAGIQTDLKAFAAHGVLGTSAVTGLTAQNTIGVQGVIATPVAFVEAQIESVLSDIGTDGIKTGMLPNRAIIESVATRLRGMDVPRVIDPVMVATSGDPLMEAEAVSAIREHLLPVATLITPNLPEAALLLGETGPLVDPRGAAERLLEFAPAVLVKGGHGDGTVCVDWLARRGMPTESMSADRVATGNNHGTGCTLASSICARLAKGEELLAACSGAKAFLTAALRRGAGLTLGGGHGPALLAPDYFEGMMEE